MPLVAGSAPDFRTLKWPRATRSLALRPLTMVDADAAWAYRSNPDVTRYLSHGPLDLAAVQARHADRVARMQPGVDDPLLPVAIEDASGFVGDAMLRCEVQDARWIGWIGYALHPRVHGRGYATEVAHELVLIASELGLHALYASARTPNHASQRVLTKTGFRSTAHQGDPDSITFERRLLPS